MRKMIAFLLLVVGLLAFKEIPKNSFDCFDKVQAVLVVTDREQKNIDKLTKNGDDFYYVFEDERAKYILKNLDVFTGIKGINLYFSKEEKVDYFKRKLDFLSEKSYVEGCEIYYGFFSAYDDFEIVDGKKINVQLAKNDTNWVLGFPVILSGF